MGFFNIHSVAKLQKKIEGGPFGGKKVAQCRKKSKGGPFGLVRYCMLRGKPFWFSSLGQHVQFASCQNFVELLVELFWSLQVVLKNTDEKT